MWFFIKWRRKISKQRITSGEIKEGNINFEELEKDYNEIKEKEKLQQIHEDNIDSDNDSDNNNDNYSDSDKENTNKDNEINIIEAEDRNELLKDLEIDGSSFLRKKGRILIFDIFKRCLIMLKNDFSLLEDYKYRDNNYVYRAIKNNEFSNIKKHLKIIALQVESSLNNLYNKYENFSIYINFIKNIKKSIKIILIF